MKTEQVFCIPIILFMNYYCSDMFFIQLYRVKSDPGVIIFQISGAKFLNFNEKS